MTACVTQQSLSQMSTINYPPKLSRAVTYDSMIPTMTCRKRLLSEQNERHTFMTQFSDDNIYANKRTKTESLGNDSNDNNQHHVSSVSLSFSDNTTYCRSSPAHQRRKSFTHINPVSCSQSTTLPRPFTTTTTATKDMLVCQQKPVIINNNENEEEDKTNNSIFLTSAELSAYISSMINTQNEKLLIIDCGLPLRHNERRIKDSFLLNINDKLSRKRLINRGLTNFLDKNQLNRLNQCEIIILYNDSIHSSPSCSNSLIQLQISSAIKCIFDEIKRYDINKTMYVLQSSFDEFYQHYPSLCYISTSTHIPINEISSPSPTTDIESYEMSEIYPGLYLGNARDAENMKLLKQNQIKIIINISTTIPCYYETETSFEYLQLPCNDSCQENILQYFETTLEYIHKNLLLNQNVLVHCQGGISRSPSFVMGYLMKYYSKTFDQAYSLVRDKRKIINPNLNFLAQLTRYEQILSSSSPQ